MRIECFTIPIQASASATANMNQFLATHAILAIERQFVADGQNSVWAICVTYQEGNIDDSTGNNSKVNKIDYREVLTEKQFAVYVKLRDLRKMLAEKEGIPAYALFNNKQLSEIVLGQFMSIQQLKTLTGVGETRIQKYGEPFIKIMQEMKPLLMEENK